MRFEIGPGGMLLILLGVAGLSGAVFGLGLVAGHELSGPEPGSQPVVAAYPLPGVPPASAPAAPAPVTASAPAPAAPAEGAVSAALPPENSRTPANAAVASLPSKPAASPPDVAPKSPPAAAPAPAAARKTATSRAAAASRAARASTAVTAPDEDLSTGDSVAPPSDSGTAAGETAATSTDEEEGESAPAAPIAPTRRRLAAVNPAAPRAGSGPYSVQIDAMMDYQGAQQMAQKIKAKGFEPYVVPTQVDGRTWYRLRVGHYATPEDAQAAQSKLHQEFNQ